MKRFIQLTPSGCDGDDSFFYINIDFIEGIYGTTDEYGDEATLVDCRKKDYYVSESLEEVLEKIRAAAE